MLAATKTCFVICPINQPNTPQRKRSDTLLNHVIKPVSRAMGYKVHRADLSPAQDPSQTIDASISARIFEADLVVADLTDLNSNVLYELGKRHAWGKACVHLSADGPGSLPFDIRNYKVISYDLSDPDQIEMTKACLKQEISAWERSPSRVPAFLSPHDVIAMTRSTVVLEIVQGRRDHYFIAEKLAKRPCKAMFLMQRSSSLLLGPEKGWSAEQKFYDALIARVGEAVEFYHVVSLEGLSRHLERQVSIFPDTEAALGLLAHSKVRGKDFVALVNPSGEWFFKRIEEENADPDLKPDRQARTFMIQEHDGSVEGVVVLDLGGIQVSFHMRGPSMNDFYAECMRFYKDRCVPLTWDELAAVVPAAEEEQAIGKA